MKHSPNLLIIGLGIQGKKRLELLKSSGYKKITTVDPFGKADLKDLTNCEIDKITHAFVCTPDSQKLEVIHKLLGIPKILVEKPMFTNYDSKILKKLYLVAENRGSQIYTSFNHRFEKNLSYLKNELLKDKIGTIYQINLEYSNGTAQQVKKSKWRNSSDGVIVDLLPHLLYIFRYLFPDLQLKIVQSLASSYETKCYDWVTVSMKADSKYVNMTSSYIKWKNFFKVEIIGSMGNFKLFSLPKWSDSTFYHQTRKFPLGNPVEIKKHFPKGDISFSREHNMFINSYSHSNLQDYELNKYINHFVSITLEETKII